MYDLTPCVEPDCRIRSPLDVRIQASPRSAMMVMALSRTKLKTQPKKMHTDSHNPSIHSTCATSVYFHLRTVHTYHTISYIYTNIPRPDLVLLPSGYQIVYL